MADAGGKILSNQSVYVILSSAKKNVEACFSESTLVFSCSALWEMYFELFLTRTQHWVVMTLHCTFLKLSQFHLFKFLLSMSSWTIHFDFTAKSLLRHCRYLEFNFFCLSFPGQCVLCLCVTLNSLNTLNSHLKHCHTLLIMFSFLYPGGTLLRTPHIILVIWWQSYSHSVYFLISFVFHVSPPLLLPKINTRGQELTTLIIHWVAVTIYIKMNTECLFSLQ